LQDRPGSLATASYFLRTKRINIVLSESCNTYQERAHWDAICDLSETEGFSALKDFRPPYYEQHMEEFLDVLSLEFQAYMQDPRFKDAFLPKPAQLARFSPLSGLNDTSFVCSLSHREQLRYRAGGIEIPKKLAGFISGACRMGSGALPEYAMITGNTEQRYLRVHFLKDYDHMFRLVVRNKLRKFAGGGVGVINQFLSALPKGVNLIKTSNQVLEKDNDNEGEIGLIEIIGHWDLSGMDPDAQAKRDYMKLELTKTVESLKIIDANGTKHDEALSVVEFASPKTLYPRVFISYSTRHEEDKLNKLKTALLENHFHPVLGTDPGELGHGASLAGHRVTPDVSQKAFQLIPTCVALISLQVRRNDFKVRRDDFKVPRNKSKIEKYILPPWTVAEEVFAFSSGIGIIIRLKDQLIEDPRYNQHTLTHQFSDEKSYEEAVEEVMAALNEFRNGPDFKEIRKKAREVQYQKRYPPGDS
jgi:hypothetical protein